MKKILPLIAIMAIIVISGCTTKDISTGPAGYGLEIVNFSSNVNEIYSTQTTFLTMQVENQGQSKINENSGLALLIIPSDWDVREDNNQEFKKDVNFEDEKKGTTAGIEFFKWTLTAPPLSEGQTTIYPIIGRIYYDYQTSLTGTLWVYPETEAYSEKQKGATLETMKYETTRGPISISAVVSPDPVTVYSDKEIFSLTITLENLDSGTVYQNGIVSVDDYTIPEEQRNAVTLRVNTPTGIDVDETCYDDAIFFGDTATIVCDVEVATAPKTKQSYPITITADYGYYVEKQLSLTVNGREPIAPCTSDSDCEKYGTTYTCDGGRCVKEGAVVTPTDYELSAAITADGLTVNPTDAEKVSYCPGIKFGSKYEFELSDVTSSSATIKITGYPDASDTAEQTINKGSAWSTDRSRASVNVEIDEIDATNKKVEATITLPTRKVMPMNPRFTSTSQSESITSPSGTAYTMTMTAFDDNVDPATNAYPNDLYSATFSIGGKSIQVFRTTAGACTKIEQSGSDYIGIGIDTSATMTSDSTADVPVIVAVGTSYDAVRNTLKNGYYKDDCSSLTKITYASGC